MKYFNIIKLILQLKNFDQHIKNIADKIANLQTNYKQNKVSLTEEYKQQIEEIISQKTNFLVEDYNSLAKFAARLEDNLKSEFEMKIAKILNDIGQENFIKNLKDNSNEFENKLKMTFEDLNGRIKGFEEKISNFEKRKEELFWNVRSDFERKFKEDENYFLTQINVFKNLLNTKMESKDFKNIMEDILETKTLEIKSDLFMNQNVLKSQSEEMRIIKDENQSILDNINFQVKESLNSLTQKINSIEDLQNSDRNYLIEFETKICEFQENIEKFKLNFNNLQKGTEEKIIKENEAKMKEMIEAKEFLNTMKDTKKKTENLIEELKNENQFSKINQLELLLNEFSSSVQKNQDESKNLLETLKNKVNILSIENLRLKERENMLLKEIEEANKKQKLMLTLEHKLFNECILNLFNNSIFT